MTIESDRQTRGTRASKRRPPRSVLTRHSPIIAAANSPNNIDDGADDAFVQLAADEGDDAIQIDQVDVSAPPPLQDPNEPRSNKVICFYWQWGHCKYGSQCRYQHPPTEFNTVRRPVSEPISNSFQNSSATKRAQMRIQSLEHEVQQLKQDLSNQRETVAMAQSVLMNVSASVAAASVASSAVSPILLVQPQVFQPPAPLRPFIQPNYRQRKQRRGATISELDSSMQPESALIANGQPQPVFFPSSLPFQRFGASAHAVAPQADLTDNPRQSNKRKPSSPPVPDGDEEPQQQQDDSSVAPLAEVRRGGRRKGRGGRRR